MELLFLLSGLVGVTMFSDQHEQGSDDSVPNGREPTEPEPTEPEPTEPRPTGTELNGTEGNDTVNGTSETDIINALPGDDLINGYGGDDLLYGGGGNDTFAWHEGEDTIFGGAGNDIIFDNRVPFDTSANLSVIDGGAGDDIIGFDGGSTVTGGAGDDAFSLFHDQQTDAPSVITDFDAAQDSLTVYLSGVTGSAGSSLRVEDWDDGEGANLYYGDELLARINGAQGLDPSAIDLQVSLAQDGSDISFADGDGDTTIFGNEWNDTIFGQDGDDLIVVGDKPAFLGSSPQGGENLAYGGAGDDTLGGSGGTFTVEEMGDGDRPNTVSYYQEISRDTLFGGAGDDYLLSENGNDLTGGDGADVFAVSHLTGENAVGFTLDPTVIADFDPAMDEMVVTNDSVPTGAALSVVVWANGLGSDILAGTTVIAKVTSGQTLTVGDIRMENHLIEAYLNA